MAAVAETELIQSQKPGVSSRSPMRVQGPKALDHPQLLCQTTCRELDGKGGWGSLQDQNRRPYGILMHSKRRPEICIIFMIILDHSKLVLIPFIYELLKSCCNSLVQIINYTHCF